MTRKCFFEASSECLAELTLDGVFVRLNPAWEAELVRSREAALGTALVDWVHEDDLAATQDGLKRLADGLQDEHRFEVRFRRADSTWCHLAWSLSVQHDARRLFATVRDVSVQVEERERLERENEHFKRRDLIRSLDLDTVLSAFPDIHLRLDAEGRILGFHAGGDLALEPTRFLGGRLHDLLPMEETPRLDEVLARTLRGDRRTITIELVGRRGRQPHEARFSRLGEDQIAVSLRDVGFRLEREDRLREAEARYRDLYENAPDMYVTVSAKTGCIIDCNFTTARMLGYAKSVLVGRSVFELYDPSCVERARSSFSQFLEHGLLSGVELTLVKRRGATLPVSLNATPLRDPRGNIVAARSVWRDVTQLSQARGKLRTLAQRLEEEVRERTAELGAMFENATVGNGRVDLDLKLRAANPALCTLLGGTEADLEGRCVTEFLASKEDRRSLEGLAVGRVEKVHTECRLVRADGRVVWAFLGASLTRNVARDPWFLTLQVVDVTARKRAEAALVDSEKHFRSAFDDAPTGMGIVSLEAGRMGRFLQVNSALEKLTRMTSSQLCERTFGDLMQFERSNDLEAGSSGERRIARLDGDSVAVRFSTSIVTDQDERPIHALVQLEDVSAEQEARHQMAHQAFHDTLTGLPNRAALDACLDFSLAGLDSSGDFVAVLYLDLDRFKSINDSLGHTVGDELLVEVAQRLSSSIRPHDTVARLGGDEFVIVSSGFQDVAELEDLVKRVEQRIGLPMTIAGHALAVSASIGIALARTHDIDREEILRSADLAMYKAKKEGPGNHAIYDETLHQRAMRRLEVESELRDAIASDRLELFYQPIVDLDRGGISSVEALLRVRNPEGDLLPPGEFIEVADESGLIVPVGRWVMGEAMRQLKTWSEAGIEPPRMAINVSACQLQDGQLLDSVRNSARRAGVDLSYLTLEMTETSIFEAKKAFVRDLDVLREEGATVAIDDFGTGYSSLTYLKRFPADVVKVDRSFVAGCEEDGEDRAIVEAIVQLAHTLGRTVVAEGVESREQLDWLRSIGCDLAQGYWFQRPVPAEQLEELFLASERERLSSHWAQPRPRPAQAVLRALP